MCKIRMQLRSTTTSLNLSFLHFLFFYLTTIQPTTGTLRRLHNWSSFSKSLYVVANNFSIKTTPSAASKTFNAFASVNTAPAYLASERVFPIALSAISSIPARFLLSTVLANTIFFFCDFSANTASCAQIYSICSCAFALSVPSTTFPRTSTLKLSLTSDTAFNFLERIYTIARIIAGRINPAAAPRTIYLIFIYEKFKRN